jgi:hypothetical protein
VENHLNALVALHIKQQSNELNLIAIRVIEQEITTSLPNYIALEVEKQLFEMDDDRIRATIDQHLQSIAKDRIYELVDNYLKMVEMNGNDLLHSLAERHNSATAKSRTASTAGTEPLQPRDRSRQKIQRRRSNVTNVTAVSQKET